MFSVETRSTEVMNLTIFVLKTKFSFFYNLCRNRKVYCTDKLFIFNTIALLSCILLHYISSRQNDKFFNNFYTAPYNRDKRKSTSEQVSHFNSRLLTLLKLLLHTSSYLRIMGKDVTFLVKAEEKGKILNNIYIYKGNIVRKIN